MATGGVLPAGAPVMVRTVDVITTEGSQPGTPFQATLVNAIKDADGTEIAPAGAQVLGRVVESQGGGAVRKPRLAIALSSIQAGGNTVPIQTNEAGAEGGHGGALKKIGAGTLIGAAAGSAGAGAAVGGAAVLLSGQNHIVVPKGTLVEFKLSQPARFR